MHVRPRPVPGEDWIDDHHLYVIREEGREPRLEHATIRQWFGWDRACLDEVALAAGFGDVRTEWFEGYGFGGTTFSRLVARKA